MTFDIMTRMITVGLVLLMINEVLSSRVIRRTGDIPPQGQCIYYNRGGISRVHYYICCNNCAGATPPSCPSVYQSASNEQYCGQCGVDEPKGNGQQKDEFSCGGCSGQLATDKNCSSWWKNIPGFCWAYAQCFRNQCKRSLFNCGNGVCDPGETSKNCPMDCCYKDNPEMCGKANFCNNTCCGEPNCCGVNKTSRPLAMPKHTIFVIIQMLTLFIRYD